MTTHLLNRFKKIARRVRRPTADLMPTRGAASLGDVKARFAAQDNPETDHGKPEYWLNYSARSALSFVSWDVFTATAMSIFAKANDTGEARRFYEVGLAHGTLPEGRNKDLKRCFRASPVTPYEGDDFGETFSYNPWIFEHSKAAFNTYAIFRRPSSEMIKLLCLIAQDLKAELRRSMGHEFKIVSTRMFELKPLETEIGPHIWHRDSHPAGTKKLMIYTDETNEDAGSTEYRRHDGQTFSVTGSGGQWVLFENARVLHRGLPPKTRPRPVIELTLMPALETDVDQIEELGLNAICPWFPSAAADPPLPSPYFSADPLESRLLLRAHQLANLNIDVAPACAGIDNIIKR